MARCSSSAVVCCLLFGLLISWTAHVSGEPGVFRVARRLMDEASEDGKRVALKDRTLAMLTKYELPDAKTVNSTAKVYALFGWQEDEKAIKYAVLMSNASSEALSAASGADVKGVHLVVDSMRGEAPKDQMPLAKVTGDFPVDEGFKIIAMGTIKDANVSSWTNSLGIKTVAALWDHILEGHCALAILTTKFPDGEVRGQIDWNYEDLEVVEDLAPEDVRKDEDMWRLSFLTAYELTGAVVGNKTGRAMAIYAWDGTKILYGVIGVSKPDAVVVKSYAEIVGAHLHFGALRGANAKTKVALTVPNTTESQVVKNLKVYAKGEITDDNVKTSNAANSTVTSAKQLFEQIVAGNTYTNIHTTANADGEVRGQDDWTYQAIDVLKDNIPPLAGKGGGKSNAATTTLPYLSALCGAVLGMLLL